MLGRACVAMPDTSAGSCSSLQQFANTHPGNAQVEIYAASSILHSSGGTQNIERARSLLNEAVRSDPHASEAFYQLGALDQLERQWANSVHDLEQAIALRPPPQKLTIGSPAPFTALATKRTETNRWPSSSATPHRRSRRSIRG